MSAWSDRIRTGGKEPIVVFAMDSNGDPLTGKTDLKIHIRRLSDNYYFDWADNTFKPAGVVFTLLQVLVEVDAVHSPGEYELDAPPSHSLGFNTLSILNATPDETYYVTAVQDGGTDISGLPHVGEIKVGDYIDDIGTGTTEDRYPVIF